MADVVTLLNKINGARRLGMEAAEPAGLGKHIITSYYKVAFGKDLVQKTERHYSND